MGPFAECGRVLIKPLRSGLASSISGCSGVTRIASWKDARSVRTQVKPAFFPLRPKTGWPEVTNCPATSTNLSEFACWTHLRSDPVYAGVEVVAPDQFASVATNARLVAFLPARFRGVELDRVGGVAGHGFGRRDVRHSAPEAGRVRVRCAAPRRAESGRVPALKWPCGAGGLARLGHQCTGETYCLTGNRHRWGGSFADAEIPDNLVLAEGHNPAKPANVSKKVM